MIREISITHRRSRQRYFVIRNEYIWKEKTPRKVRRLLLQPLLNGMALISAMMIMRGKARAVNVYFR